MPRLFFALRPDALQCASLVAQFAGRFASAGIPAVPADNLHVTLCFLGNVPEERLPALCAAADLIRATAIWLRFDAFEFWPAPKVLCATASPTGVEGAPVLAGALQRELTAAGLTPDAKPFRAHITLARKVRATAVTSLGLPVSMEPPLLVHSDRFVLMRSDREEAGSIYSVVAEWPLDTD